MGNNSSWKQELPAIKAEFSKPIRNFEADPRPHKPVFSKLAPKSPHVDDDFTLGNALCESQNQESQDETQFDEDEVPEESAAEEIKIRWNSFIKMKKKNYLEEYTVVGQIGRGGFGTVNKVKAKYTGVFRAAKKIKKSQLDKEEHEKLFQQMAIMINLDHPNIARLFEVYDYKSNYVLILELCEGGELFKKIITKNTNEKVTVAMMAQLLKALVYLHGRGIVHRDLKPQNLLFEKGSNYLKLIDFGIAVNHKPGDILTARIGTPYYIAPEVLCKRYNEKCDTWSAGVIMYMMLTYRPPFSGDTELEVMEKIIKSEPSYQCPGFSKVSNQCLDLLKKLLVKNPEKRLSAAEAYMHPCIQAHLQEICIRRPKTATLQNISTFRFENKLQAVVYTYIVSQILSSDEKSLLKQVFQELDHNHDGVISTEQLKQALLTKKEVSEERIKFLVRIIDTNGSGEIDFTEFIVAALEPDSLTSSHFDQAFSYFDIDHSGLITYDEIAAFLEDKESSQDEIRDIFREVDKNNDGVISKEEFIHILTQRTKNCKQQGRLKRRKTLKKKKTFSSESKGKQGSLRESRVTEGSTLGKENRQI